MYLVGWHRDVRSDSSTDAFQFPRSIPMMPLENILKVRSVKDNASLRPQRPIARLAVDIAMFRAKTSQQGAGDWVVNTHHSKRWTQEGSRPASCVPSLTFSHSAAPWLGSRGRPMTACELVRAQGLTFADYVWPEDILSVLRLLGNTMSASVVCRILVRLLPLLDTSWVPSDPWEAGAAQRALEAEAACSHLKLGKSAFQPTLLQWLRKSPGGA